MNAQNYQRLDEVMRTLADSMLEAVKSGEFTNQHADKEATLRVLPMMRQIIGRAVAQAACGKTAELDAIATALAVAVEEHAREDGYRLDG